MQKKLVIITVGFCFSILWMMIIIPASAKNEVNQFTGFFQDLDSLQADFIQSVFDPNNTLQYINSGKIALKAPDKFLWQQLRPHQETIVVTNNSMYSYNETLEQLVQTENFSLEKTPLAWLFNHSIKGDFSFPTLLSSDDDVFIYRSYYSKDNALYNFVDFIFENNLLKELRLTGDHTISKIELFNLSKNNFVNDRLFIIDVPKNTLIVRN